MANEIERAGVPVVLITTLVDLAKNLGVNRIVRGVAISSPTGDPTRSEAEEVEVRRDLLDQAFVLLQGA